MDKTEIIPWNGREFELTVRSSEHDGRTHWVAWIKVVGKEDLGGRNSSSFTGWSEGEVRDKAREWMIGWRN